jgi:hypothetical protein
VLLKHRACFYKKVARSSPEPFAISLEELFEKLRHKGTINEAFHREMCVRPMFDIDVKEEQLQSGRYKKLSLEQAKNQIQEEAVAVICHMFNNNITARDIAISLCHRTGKLSWHMLVYTGHLRFKRMAGYYK